MKVSTHTLNQIKWIARITGREAIELWNTVHPNQPASEAVSNKISGLNGTQEKGTDAARIRIKNIATFIQETKWRRRKKLNQQEPKDHSADRLRQRRIEECSIKI